MKTSNEIDEVTSALLDAQRNIPCSIERDATASGGSFSYDYTTLDTLIEHVKEPLNEQNLTLTQSNQTIDEKPHCVTTLIHSSGQWLRSETMLCLSSNDPQDFGKAMTYARRYSLSALLGIASEQDDDAQSVSQGSPSTSKSTQSSGGGKLSDKQKGFIKGLCKDRVFPAKDLYLAEEIEEFICDNIGVDQLDDLTKDQASGLIDKMTEWPEEDESVQDGEKMPF